MIEHLLINNCTFDFSFQISHYFPFHSEKFNEQNMQDIPTYEIILTLHKGKINVKIKASYFE